MQKTTREQYAETQTVQPHGEKGTRRFRDRLPAVENQSVVDRSIRLVLGVLLTVPVLIAAFKVDPVTWEFYTSIAACYLLLTGMLGWDPIYAAFNFRTCGKAGKPCGSFGYTAKVAMGEKPSHDTSYETKGTRPEERTKPFTDSGVTY